MYRFLASVAVTKHLQGADDAYIDIYADDTFDSAYPFMLSDDSALTYAAPAESFYTPWGMEGIDAGTGFIKSVLGAAVIIGLFCFAAPFVVDFVKGLFDKLTDRF